MRVMNSQKTGLLWGILMYLQLFEIFEDFCNDQMKFAKRGQITYYLTKWVFIVKYL